MLINHLKFSFINQKKNVLMFIVSNKRNQWNNLLKVKIKTRFAQNN